jgi:hypothetical protein
LTIELSVILRLRLLISPLVSLDHCIISHSLITSSNFPFGIFWPLCYQSFFDYVFLFPLWYLLTVMLSVILWLLLLISPLVSFDHCIISHSLITSSSFPFGIFLPLYYHSFFDYVFYFPLWYFLTFELGKLEDVIEEWLITPWPKDTKGEIRRHNQRMTDNSMCLLTIVLSVILWLRLLISPLVSFGHCIFSHSLITSSIFPFGIICMQWPEDTKGEIRRHNQRMTENTMVKRYQKGN